MESVSYDILIIGGGPAGLMAARKAAQKGVKTLLVEKGDQFGLKPCGEATSDDTLVEAELSPSQDFICGEGINRVIVHAPQEEKKVTISAESLGYRGGYILNKPIFLRKLAELAVQNGAEIWMEALATRIDRHHRGFECKISTTEGERRVEAKVVIGCDGVNSLVARTFFNRGGYRRMSCMQYTMGNCHLADQRNLEIFLGNDIAPGGYVWVFPKEEGVANVGIGVQTRSPRIYLDRFIAAHPERFGEAQVLSMGAAPVPIGGQIEETVQDGLILCGDAAGQVIPLSGEGIHPSIVAGKLAGETAAESLLKGNISRERLSLYSQEFNKTWGKWMSESLRAQRVIVTLSDQELNQLAEILTGQDIIDLANGFNVPRVAMKLLKYPRFAVKIARALL